MHTETYYTVKYYVYYYNDGWGHKQGLFEEEKEFDNLNEAEAFARRVNFVAKGGEYIDEDDRKIDKTNFDHISNAYIKRLIGLYRVEKKTEFLWN